MNVKNFLRKVFSWTSANPILSGHGVAMGDITIPPLMIENNVEAEVDAQIAEIRVILKRAGLDSVFGEDLLEKLKAQKLNELETRSEQENVIPECRTPNAEIGLDVLQETLRTENRIT